MRDSRIEKVVGYYVNREFAGSRLGLTIHRRFDEHTRGVRGNECAADQTGKVDYTVLGGFNTLSIGPCRIFYSDTGLIYVFADPEIKLFHYRGDVRVGARRCFGAKKLRRTRRKTSVVVAFPTACIGHALLLTRSTGKHARVCFVVCRRYRINRNASAARRSISRDVTWSP